MANISSIYGRVRGFKERFEASNGLDEEKRF